MNGVQVTGSAKQDALWQRLVACDFRLSDGTRLQDHVAQTTALTGARAEAAMLGYRQFLWLCAQGEGVQVPSPAIDAVWHLHLLDTRAYADFCDQVIGRMIHHSPGRPAAAKDPAYAETRAALTQHFGPAEPGLWPEPRAPRAWLRGLGLMGLGIVCCVLSRATPLWPLWVPGLALLLIGVLVWIGEAGWPVRKSDSSGCSGDSGGGGCGGD